MKGIVLSLIFFILILVMGLASSMDDIGYYKKDTKFNLNLGCSYNDSYCPSSYLCNLSIYSSDGNYVINNQAMSNESYPQYNYTIMESNLTKSGLYSGRQLCCGTAGCADYSFQFHVNAQGKEYSTTTGLVYVITLLILVGIFFLTLYGAVNIPFNNPRNALNEIIDVDYKKHLKILCIALSYTLLVAITYFLWNISYGILEFQELAKFFYFFFRSLYVVMIGFIPILFVFSLIMVFIDKKIEKMLERGLTVR